MSISQGPVAQRLSNKVVLVTGAGSGIGRSAVLLFARAGAQVAGCGRRTDALQETHELAHREGLALDLQVVDATDPAAIKNWVDSIATKYGGIDGLYNNAGFVHMAPIEEMSDHQWWDTLRGELDIVFFPTRAVWPHLKQRGGGSIVNISSLSGMRGIEDTGATAHAAAKGGVIAMTRQLAMEGAPHWIRCNAISPGPVMSPGAERFLEISPDRRRRLYGWPLLPRVGEGDDISYAGLFLLSDESRWITGINIPVDGGWSSKGGLTEH